MVGEVEPNLRAPLRPTVARLLAALSDPPGREVPVAELVAVVWGEQPPSRPIVSLQTTVARLRRHLPPGAVQHGAEGYRLDPDIAREHLALARDTVPRAPAEGDLAFRPYAPPTWRLVGREGLLATAMDAIGAGRSVVLHGAAGCGKSRVADEVVLRLHSAGAPAVLLRCRAAASDVHLGVFAPLLDGSMPRGGLPLVVAARHSIVGRLAGRRLVLGLDDVDLLDPLSAVLVSHLVHDGHAVLVGTHRSEAAVPIQVAQLWHEGRCVHVPVPLLDQGSTTELGEVVVGRFLDPSERADLWARTAGNPLFVTALLDLRTGGGSGADLTALIGEQVARLPTALRDALSVVALAEPVGATILEELADLESLVALEHAHLVAVERDGRRTSVRVLHPLFAEHVRSTTSRLLGRGIFGQLADAVLARGARRQDDVLRVASWQLAAGQQPAPGIALAAAMEALDRRDVELAERLARPRWEAGADAEAALVLLQAGYEHAPASDLVPLAAAAVAASEGEMRQRLAWAGADVLLFKAADPLGAADFVARAPGDRTNATIAFGLAAAGRAEEAAARVGDTTAAGSWREVVHLADAASLALVQLCRAPVADELVTGLARRTHPSGPAGDIARLYLAAARARIDAALGRIGESIAALRNAGDLARATLDVPGEGEVGCALAAVLCVAGRPVEAVALTEAAAAAAARTGHLTVERWARSVQGWAAALAGDVSGAAAAVDAWAALPGADPGARATVFEVSPRLLAAGLARAHGDLSAARAGFDAAVDSARELGLRWDELVALHERSLALEVGDTSAAHAARAAALAADAGPLAAALAATVASVAADDPIELERAADTFGALGALSHRARALRAGAEAAARAGRGELAQRLLRSWDVARSACDAPVGGRPVVAVDPLTAREREIAELAARGRTSAAIAEQLGLSARTVDNHLGRAFTKLGVSGRAELAGVLLGRSVDG